jgi:hypothetical protein
MRWLAYLVWAAGASTVACGDESGDPLPVPGDLCAAQHEEAGVMVCDELHAEAPFVRLPAGSETRVIAGLQNEAFVTADGKTYAYPGATAGGDPEDQRHAFALYELELSGNRVESFRPYLMFGGEIFVSSFAGRVLEGTISRRDGEGFAFEASLPVRVEMLDEVVAPASGREAHEVRARIANLEAAVTAADGSCLPALTSYGDEAPFAAGATVSLTANRAPWMHGLGDDEFVFEVFVDGVTVGSMMGGTWYRGPIDVVRGELGPAGTYDGFGHGTPGSIPSLSLAAVDGGGEPCTAP